MCLINSIVASSYNGLNGLFHLFQWLVTLRDKFPWLIPDPARKYRRDINTFLQKTIQDHQNSWEKENEARDLIDAFLMESKKDPRNFPIEELSDLLVDVIKNYCDPYKKCDRDFLMSF